MKKRWITFGLLFTCLSSSIIAIQPPLISAKVGFLTRYLQNIVMCAAQPTIEQTLIQIDRLVGRAIKMGAIATIGAVVSSVGVVWFVQRAKAKKLRSMETVGSAACIASGIVLVFLSSRLARI